MREIKFRGKRIYNGEWAYGAFVPDELERTHGEMVTWGFIRKYKPNQTVESVEMIEVDRKTVGQYTGLKDRNGTEIYEGDIIDCGFGDGNTVVYFDEKTCQFTTEQRWLWGYDKIEVLGNIYDNPELIKEG